MAPLLHQGNEPHILSDVYTATKYFTQTFYSSAAARAGASGNARGFESPNTRRAAFRPNKSTRCHCVATTPFTKTTPRRARLGKRKRFTVRRNK
jgi:hypothetical protein